jgi:hypothetical protein
VTSWEQQTLIPPEPRQIRAQDTRLLQVGATAAGYVEDLSRTHPINLQFSTGKPIKGQKNLVKKQKTHTSVRGCDLLKASMPKFLGTVDFFFKEVTAQTPSSISASLNSSEENRVESRQSV